MPSFYDHKLAKLVFRAGAATEEQIQECGRLLVQRQRGSQRANLADVLAEKGYVAPEALAEFDRRLEIEGVHIPADRRASVINAAKHAAAQLSPLELGDVTTSLGDTVVYCAACGEMIVEELPPAQDQPLCARCARRALIPGEVCAGFRVGEILATGRLGPLFAARDLAGRRDAVMRYLRIETFLSAEAVHAFLERCIILTVPRSPLVVPVLRAGRLGKDVFVAHERITGQTFGTFAATADARGAIQFGEELCAALQALADAGLCHGELRPRKIMVDDEGRPRLLDAGLPTFRYFRVEPITDDRRYLPPSLREGTPVEGPVLDVYAAVKIIAELILRRPCEGEEALAQATKRGFAKPMTKLVATLTHPDPAELPHTAAELAALLRRARRYA